MFLKRNIPINKKLNYLFKELQVEKKIIDRKIKLIPYNRTSNFQGLNIFNIWKQIRYNPDFYEELSKYNDDYTRFILLHEAGHIAEKTLFRIENIIYTLAIIDASISTITGLMYFSYTFLIGILFVTIFTIWASIVLGFPKLKKSEYHADEFALRTFKENFPFNNLCIFVEEFFYLLNKISEDPRFKLNDNQKLIVKIFFLGRDYHPTNVERIKRLIEIANCG
jgi:Zn-dependent protease with chaperone function